MVAADLLSGIPPPHTMFALSHFSCLRQRGWLMQESGVWSMCAVDRRRELGELELSRVETDQHGLRFLAQVDIDTVEKFESLRATEQQYFTDMVQKCKDSGACLLHVETCCDSSLENRSGSLAANCTILSKARRQAWRLLLITTGVLLWTKIPVAQHRKELSLFCAKGCQT